MVLYLTVAAILTIALYGLIISNNLIKKLFFISIMQSAIIAFYLLIGKINQAIPPVMNCLPPKECVASYVNPVPQVLMLTAIVVGLAVLSIGLILIIKIKENFNTVESNKLFEKHG